MIPPYFPCVFIANEQYGIGRYKPDEVRFQPSIKAMYSVLVFYISVDIHKGEFLVD